MDFNEVKKISQLVKIKLSNEEAQRIANSLSAFIQSAQPLLHVDTSEVEPLYAFVDLPQQYKSVCGVELNVYGMRDDVVTDGNMAEEVTKYGSLHSCERGLFFVVPKKEED